MTKQEFLNEIKTRKIQVAEIVDKLATEKREASAVETVTLDSLKAEIQDFETRMKEVPAVEVHIPATQYTINREVPEDEFSLVRCFRNIANNHQLNDVEKEVVKLGQQSMKDSGLGYRGTVIPLTFEKRLLTAKTQYTGKEAVPTDTFDIMIPLRAQLVLAKAGATILNNLQGNISIPIFTGTTAFWKGENETSGNAGGGFKEKDFSPKRLTCYLPVSNLLLIQANASTEELLKRDLVNAISQKLEQTLLGTEAGSVTQPAGIFYAGQTSGRLSGSTVTWKNIVTMETAVNLNNANTGDVTYILSPSTLGAMKITAKAANTVTGFIAEGSTINGYRFLMTTNMPQSGATDGVVFGNWRDFYLCFWSGMDVIVDNLTSAKEGITNFIITLYVDGGVVRPESFVTGLLA